MHIYLSCKLQKSTTGGRKSLTVEKCVCYNKFVGRSNDRPFYFLSMILPSEEMVMTTSGIWLPEASSAVLTA